MMVVMARLTGIGQYVVILVVWGLALVLLAEIAPDWSSTLRFIIGMVAALVAVRVARATVERST
jgi:hypothetical protein